MIAVLGSWFQYGIAFNTNFSMGINGISLNVVCRTVVESLNAFTGEQDKSLGSVQCAIPEPHYVSYLGQGYLLQTASCVIFCINGDIHAQMVLIKR